MNREVMQQALEALENAKNFWWTGKDEAITALRAALAQEEQEQSDTNWLKARPHVEQFINSLGYDMTITDERVRFEAREKVDVRAQQEQEPQYTTGHCKERAKPNGCQLHNLQCGYPECDRKPAALAQEEPVAWVNAAHLQAIQEKAKALGLTLGLFGYVEIYTNESQGRVPLFTHHRREWRSLSEEEIVEIVAECAASAHRWDDISVARAIEARLRKLNNS